jgi:hypothetical protein
MSLPPLFETVQKKKEIDMRKRSAWILIVAVSALVTGFYTVRARATPGTAGYTSSTLALGRFGDVDVMNHQVIATNAWRGKLGTDIWLSMQKTKGISDLYVQNNTWQPGADTGWHSHPGHSLIIVTAGAVTDYESDDPDCKPTVYTQGMGFVDSGGVHVHLIRNEGGLVASTVAVQLIPGNAARRVDADQPSNCHM